MRISIGPVLLGWLALEIMGFMLVGSWLGFWGSLGMMFLTFILGVGFVQLQGLEWQALLREAAMERKAPQDAAGEAMLFLLAAILLILPGFFGDVIGILLLPAFVRGGLVQRWQGQNAGTEHRYRVFMNNQEQDPHRPRRNPKKSGKIIDGSYREL